MDWYVSKDAKSPNIACFAPKCTQIAKSKAGMFQYNFLLPVQYSVQYELHSFSSTVLASVQYWLYTGTKKVPV